MGNSNTLATSCKELTHWKRLWCCEGLGAGEKGDDRRWDGWMASLTRWTWVWVNSRSWWWTGRPGVLRFTGLQRVRHDWATELNWTEGDKNNLMLHPDSNICRFYQINLDIYLAVQCKYGLNIQPEITAGLQYIIVMCLIFVVILNSLLLFHIYTQSKFTLFCWLDKT